MIIGKMTLLDIFHSKLTQTEVLGKADDPNKKKLRQIRDKQEEPRMMEGILKDGSFVLSQANITNQLQINAAQSINKAYELIEMEITD